MSREAFQMHEVVRGALEDEELCSRDILLCQVGSEWVQKALSE
jgi:hypothetical protein